VLATLAVTRHETGSWRVAAAQLGYMTALAYGAAFIAYRSVSLLLG
jgi:ferrous iron transport protein B